MGFATHEHQVKGNSWCMYVALNPNTDSLIIQNDYMNKILGPNYWKMIEEHGGEKSDAWGVKKEELVQQHNELMVQQDWKRASTGKGQVATMRLIHKWWKKELNTAKLCGIHVAVIMVSSKDSAEKENQLFSNSVPLQKLVCKWLGPEKIFLSEAHRMLFSQVHETEKVPEILGCDEAQPRCIKVFKELAQKAKMGTGEHFQWKVFFNNQLHTYKKQLCSWPDDLPIEWFSVGDYQLLKTEDWQQLWTACTQEIHHSQCGPQ